MNLLEIIGINYIPIAVKWYRSGKTLQRIDVHACLGANVILCALSTGLLHRPHNVILVAVQMTVADAIHKACGHIFAAEGGVQRVRNSVETVALLWLGWAFFYYQGNSNSLASVDLNAGYVGVQSFRIGLVAALLTLNTFGAVLLAAAMLLYRLTGVNYERSALKVLVCDRGVAFRLPSIH